MLHHFAVETGCGPSGELVQANDGALYGAAAYEGPGGQGVVFRLTLDGKYEVLHAFAGADGGSPLSDLIQARDGFLYGTTAGGGDYNSGTVFRVSTSGQFSTVASFEANLHGTFLHGTLLEADDGSFYGTASYGGPLAYGVLFRVTQDGVITNLHNFAGGGDGITPGGRLTFSADHSYFVGVTGNGGQYELGTVYEFDGVNYQQLYDFDPSTATSGHSPLVLGADGETFYGFYTPAAQGSGSRLYSLNQRTRCAWSCWASLARSDSRVLRRCRLLAIASERKSRGQARRWLRLRDHPLLEGISPLEPVRRRGA